MNVYTAVCTCHAHTAHTYEHTLPLSSHLKGLLMLAEVSMYASVAYVNGD